MTIHKVDERPVDYPRLEVARAEPVHTATDFTGLDAGEITVPKNTVQPASEDTVEPAAAETVEPAAQEKRPFKVNGELTELTYAEFMRKGGATQQMWDEASVVKEGGEGSGLPWGQVEGIIGYNIARSSFSGEVGSDQTPTIFTTSLAGTVRLLYPTEDLAIGIAARYLWSWGVNNRKKGDTSDAAVGNLNILGGGPSVYAKLTRDSGLVFDVFVFNWAWSGKGVEQAGDTGFKKIDFDGDDNFTSGGDKIAIGANVAYQHKISKSWSLTAGLSLDYLRRKETSGESTEYIEAIIPKLGVGILVGF